MGITGLRHIKEKGVAYMIKRRVVCRHCGRTLLQLYSHKVKAVTCVCGTTTYLENVKALDGIKAPVSQKPKTKKE